MLFDLHDLYDLYDLYYWYYVPTCNAQELQLPELEAGSFAMHASLSSVASLIGLQFAVDRGRFHPAVGEEGFTAPATAETQALALCDVVTLFTSATAETRAL